MQKHGTRSLRWVALLVASVLLHVMLFNWVNGNLGLPSLRQEAQNLVTTVQLAPAAAAPPAIQRSAPPAVKPKPKPRRPVPPPVTGQLAKAATVSAEASTGAPETDDEPAVSTLSDAVLPAPAQDNEVASAQPAAPRYTLSPPPSAELKYDVQALREGQRWHGTGIFRWETAGNSYSVTGEAGITLIFRITVLNFKSEGTINELGIAPVLYSEKPWRKPMTNTHFQHANGKISFSASTATYPYQGGEQDRASVMWQLASIGRGDPGQFAPGTEFDIVVAGARDADTWRITVAGMEEIDTAFGAMPAWHVVRAPRPGSYDQTIHIWFAPQKDWYPVKVRYLYANGDHLDLSLSELTPGVPR